jgi:hypothetical protein
MDAAGAKDQEGGGKIERIAVALDSSAHSMAAPRAAAMMATRFEAELLGLFVEDANVRRLTELPFVQEVGFYTGSCRRVERGPLSRQLHVQVGRMRRYFQVKTRHIATCCIFREIRGRVAREVLREADAADVVILGEGAWSTFDTGRLAPDVREVLSRVPACTLVLAAQNEVKPPLRIVYPGTPLADKAPHRCAAVWARAARRVRPGRRSGEASLLRERVNDALEWRRQRLLLQTLTEASIARLAHLTSREKEGTLVVPADAAALEEEALLNFLEEMSIPVLVVR